MHAAYDELKKLESVGNDGKNMVQFVNDVELCYSQLGEIKQLQSITMSHADGLCDLLPITIQKYWIQTFQKLSENEKIHPFSSYMAFLEEDQTVAMPMTDRSAKGSKSKAFLGYTSRYFDNMILDTCNDPKACLLSHLFLTPFENE